MASVNTSLSLARPTGISAAQRLGATLAAVGVLTILVATLSAEISAFLPLTLGLTCLVAAGVVLTKDGWKLSRISIALLAVGVIALLFTRLKYAVPSIWPALIIVLSLTIASAIYYWDKFGRGTAGIRNNHTVKNDATRKGGTVAWFLALVFTGFYILLYWFPQHLEGLIRAMDPVSQALRGAPADQWLMYGLFYSMAVVLMGWRFILKYRHNRYQIVRTVTVSFFQLVIAFILPYFLEALNRPSGLEYSTHYFHYFWPLDYDALWPDTLSAMQGSLGFGSFAMFWSLAAAFIAVPVLTYFFGKRWYCSWVCGCGGLAETAGDPFRHLSDKSLKAWRIERVLIHSVLVLITVVTLVLLVHWQWPGLLSLDEKFASGLKSSYGFVIASTFAGVIGVGFYPIMGSRVWCRFGCPQAAILGILQKWFSRFRITTNGGQCISCGNCSTYCEMGIDVKWYAQRGQNIVRASCVGCGICSAVCPRGVLRLESGPIKGKTSFFVDRDELKVLGNG